MEAWQIRQGLSRLGKCPKLEAYWTFEHCGYRKTRRSCSQPKRFRRCPLPRHDLRNGSLSQASYSLFLFMRDVAGGDFVAWLDQRLRDADDVTSPGRSQRLRDAVVTPLLNIHGVSHKVLHMTLANLLLAGGGKRKRWQMAGAAMVAIDSLVHAWLWRSGILQRLGIHHPYGPACYMSGGCETVINLVSSRIDTREFNPSFPQDFPRFVQKAIWSFCAASGLDQCNGNRVDDRARCDLADCPVFGQCDRVALHPARRSATASREH